MGASRVRLRAATGVAAVAGVTLRSRVRSAIGCGCTPLEVGTRTLGVCTSGVAGEIGGGEVVRWVGTCITGRALVRGVLLMLGRDLGTLGSGSAVGARMRSVGGYGGAGEWLRHCSKIWRILLMACSWLLQMVYGVSLVSHVKRFRASVTLSFFVIDGCVSEDCKNFTVSEIMMDFFFLLISKKQR